MSVQDIVDRLHRCIARLDSGAAQAGYTTLAEAQELVENLRQPPNRITMRFGEAPIGHPGERLWHAEASWGPGDVKTICYSDGWARALIMLALTLRLEEGDDVD